MTIEHVFSEAWLKRVMPSEGAYQFNLLRNEQGEVFTKLYEHPRPEIEAGGFCGSCNSGWMDSLDKQVEPLLTTMLRGQRRVLEPPIASTLATWACKIAMVADSMQPRPALSQEHRDYLFDHEAPPPGWRIWLAATHPSAQHRVLIAPITLVRPSGLGYMFTMALDQFVAQVLVLPSDEATDGHPLEPALVRPLWPLPNSSRSRVAWPEGRRLQEDELQYFTSWAAGLPMRMADPPPPVPLHL